MSRKSKSSFKEGKKSSREVHEHEIGEHMHTMKRERPIYFNQSNGNWRRF